MSPDVIRAAVDVAPEKMDMDEFVDKRDCGTVACIAGNCLLQHGYTQIDQMDIRQIEQICGGLMDINETQMGRLFYSFHWPAALSKKLPYEAAGTAGYLAIVKERVEVFIASGGAV